MSCYGTDIQTYHTCSPNSTVDSDTFLLFLAHRNFGGIYGRQIQGTLVTDKALCTYKLGIFFTRLHGVINQKNIVRIFSSMKTSTSLTTEESYSVPCYENN